MKMNALDEDVIVLKLCTMCTLYKGKEEYINKCGKCKECRAIHRKKYREENFEKCKEKDRKHYEKFKEKKLEQFAKYYSENRDKIREQRKKYREDNYEKCKKEAREYYHKNIERRLGLVYRNRVRREIKSGKNYLKYLGCSIEELKRWFEFNFELDGFTWDDYNELWEIDHVIPCAKHNMNNEVEVLECFNWRNTKPALKTYNKRKNSKIDKNQILEHELRLFIYDGKLKPIQNLDTAV